MSIKDSSGVLVASAICFGLGCCVLVLSETVLVLERSLGTLRLFRDGLRDMVCWSQMDWSCLFVIQDRPE